MNFVKRITTHPLTIIIAIFLILYWDFFIRGLIPFPGDTLVGSYYPWLDFRWGYALGVPVKNPIISDVFSQLFLWKYLAVDYLKQGVLPLWNQFSFSGTPLLANYQSAVLFPMNILLLLPKYYGWGVYISFSTLSALLSMYLFLTNHVKSKIARLSGSLIFTVAGPMTTWVEFGNAVWAISIIPLVFWCVDKTVDERKKRFVFGIIAFSAVIFLTGHVQIATYLSLLLPIYAWQRAKNSKSTHLFLKVCLALLLAIGLAATQIIPTFSFFQRSVRSEESYASTFNYGLTPPAQIVRLWIADFFGNPTTGNCFIGNVSCHELASFLGTITLPIILPLFLTLKKRAHPFSFFAALFLLSLVLSLNHPISRLIFSLPLSLFTYSSASRLLFLTTFAAAALTAGAIDKLNSPNYRKKAAISSVLFLLLTLFALASIDSPHQIISLRNSLLPLLFLISLIILVTSKLKTQILVAVLLLLLAFDLIRYFKKYNPFVPQTFIFPDTPVTDFLKNQPGTFRIARQYGPVLPPNTWTHYGLEAIEGYDPLRLLTYNRLFHLAENEKYFNKAGRYSELIDLNPKFLDLLNVKYFVAIKETPNRTVDKLTRYGYKPIFEDGRTVIYENPLFKERAFFIHQLRTVKDEQSLAYALESSDFSPTTEAVSSSETKYPTKYAVKNSVTAIVEKPNGLTIDLNSPSEGFLLISNAYDPGWKATIDGKSSPVIQVDGALQGLFIPTGSHKLDLNYIPDPVTIGSTVSLLSLGAIAIFLKAIHV